jgi:Cofactor assembly of complex C subunit B
MKANNYEVADAGDTITFKGVVKRSLSQAFFLVFVTAMSMVTLALVLNIQFNELGTWRFRLFDDVAISGRVY